MKAATALFLLFWFAFATSCQTATRDRNSKYILINTERYENGKTKLLTYSKDDTLLFKGYYPNGHKKRVAWVYNSNEDTSNFRGIVYEYYDDGMLEKSTTLEKGYNGIQRTYYRNRHLGLFGRMKQGKRDSTWTWYYDNGALLATACYRNDTVIGKRVSFYRNSGIYDFCLHGFETSENLRGKIVYQRHYDSTGRVLNEKGFPLAKRYSPNVSRYSTFNLELLAALAPRAEINLEIMDISSGKRDIVKRLASSREFYTSDKGCGYTISRVCKDTGSFTWLVYSVITDSLHGKTMSHMDTVKFAVR